jgi:hypothetical protein
LRKGDVYVVGSLKQDQGSLLVATSGGCVFRLVLNQDSAGNMVVPRVEVGTDIIVGSVCGDWCNLNIGADRLRARILCDDSV